ncbi:hypothetical protein CBL_06546 [Carabus blaptoides fortunei]
MYDLSPRKGLDIATGTPENVGPNTYFTRKCRKFIPKNYVPFLSSAPRNSKLQSYIDVLYDPPQMRPKIKYGNSLQFTAPRNTIEINTEPEICDMKVSPCSLKWRESTKYNGKLYVGPIPYTTQASAPSVPSRMDTNGYDISENNVLIKNPPDELHEYIGPGHYDVPTGELNSTTLKYRGCAWSKSKGTRTKMSVSDTPGPAKYDVNYDFCGKQKQKEKFHVLMRKCCNVPRVTCELICRAKDENLPGPGYYEIVNIDKITKVQNLSLKPKPFNGGAKRFVYNASDVPGPQHYQRCFCSDGRKDFCIKDAPFLYVSKRFQTVKSQTPGPGWYACAASGAKPGLYGVVKAPFDSNAPRKWTFLETHLDTPGPGDYSAREVKCCPQTEEPKEAYVFRSRTCRFRKMKSEDQPNAASYSIANAYNYSRNRRSHFRGRIPFHSSEKQLAKIYDFAGIVLGLETPGVGKYDIQKTLCPKKGPHFNMAQRFKVEAETLGPGHYTLQPLVSESMYRAKTTHNSRLMKEVKRNYPESRLPQATVKAQSNKNHLHQLSRPKAPATEYGHS